MYKRGKVNYSIKYIIRNIKDGQKKIKKFNARLVAIERYCSEYIKAINIKIEN